jgi:hypothetical protein
MTLCIQAKCNNTCHLVLEYVVFSESDVVEVAPLQDWAMWNSLEGSIS